MSSSWARTTRPGVLIERMFSTAYLGTTTASRRSARARDIENVPIERLQAFYQRYYQPDNAVLLVAGKFDEAKTLDSGRISTSRRFRGPRACCRRSTPKSRRRTASARSRSAASATRNSLPPVITCPPGSHPDFAAVDMLTQILADTPSGRLHKALVETKKACQSCFDFPHSTSRA